MVRKGKKKKEGNRFGVLKRGKEWNEYVREEGMGVGEKNEGVSKEGGREGREGRRHH